MLFLFLLFSEKRALPGIVENTKQSFVNPAFIKCQIAIKLTHIAGWGAEHPFWEANFALDIIYSIIKRLLNQTRNDRDFESIIVLSLIVLVAWCFCGVI